MSAQVCFVVAIALAGYAFAGYPLLALGLSRWRGSTPASGAAQVPITVVIAARNEAPVIVARLANLLQTDYPRRLVSVVLVDDGSSDGTAALAEALRDPRLQVVRQESARGKAAAINKAMDRVGSPVTVFADARQRFTRATLGALVAPFADPRVGVVSGELVPAPRSPGGHPVAAEGSYARLERALRHAEARLGWGHAASGAVYALRSELFRPLPEGLVLDDLFVPLQAVRQGYLVRVAREAVAIDEAGTRIGHEFRRKLRTLAGNWQLIGLQPWLLLPWRNPVFFAWASHKLARLLAPWALLLALLASAQADGGWLQVAFYLQLAAYALALAALAGPRWTQRIPLAATAGSFLLLNAAALLSLPVFLGNRRLDRIWRR